MKRTAIALTLISALLVLLVVGLQSVKAFPETIVVPDDYSSIQEAIDHASAGDTVYVKKGIYYHDGPEGKQRIDGLTINKSISLIGEDSKTTILKPNYTSMNRLRSGIYVTADNVTVSGFTIDGTAENATYKNRVITFVGYQRIGIFVHTTDFVTPDPYGCKIIGNIFTGHSSSSIEDHSKGAFISENTISENITGRGIHLIHSSDTIISGNHIESSGKGIDVWSSENVTIKQNNITGKGFDDSRARYDGGIFPDANPIYIYENNITNSGFGIKFSGTKNCIVYNNNITHNKFGILLLNRVITTNGNSLDTGNMVYNNNLMNNEKNAFVEHSYPSHLLPVSGNGTDVVSWDNGFVGNYWSDYQGQGTYVIDENNVDYHPLTQQVDISTTAPTTFTDTLTIAVITTVSAVAIGIVLLVYFKKRKHRK